MKQLHEQGHFDANSKVVIIFEPWFRYGNYDDQWMEAQGFLTIPIPNLQKQRNSLAN